MNILVVSSEAVPYVKTGGLGDVAGTLAEEFAEKGDRVRMVLPFYKEIREKKYDDIEVLIPSLTVPMGDCVLHCRIWERRHDSGLRVYFIEHDEFFNRDPIYDDGDQEYSDNGARFAFFSKASLELAIELNFKPDIVQCNDWQTALVPYYLKCWGWDNRNFFKRSASVLTLHNMGYQGMIDLSLAPFIGLNYMQVRDDEFEAIHGLNLLKGGIFYADKIVTVSPTYAQEILSEPGGCGLSYFLNRRREDIVGILNGIDTREWSPKMDHYLPENFSADKMEGKDVCKLELQKKFHLRSSLDVPIFGMVGRMAEQKGLDLLQDCVHEILQWDLQLIILGSGDPKLSGFFGDLPKYYPGKVGAYIGFQPYLAHLIEAGSDFFIMPSRYEPCGLNQMYSMLYGTLPVVRATGGLNDTVENYNPNKDNGTGFSFYDISSYALKNTLRAALDTWYNKPEDIKKMRKRGMTQDFTWEKAVVSYKETFEQALERRASWS